MKECGRVGCRALIPLGLGGYCPVHAEQALRERQKYANARRDREAEAFYRTARWQKTRAAQIRREPVCRACGALAAHVDHIQPVSRGGARFDAENLQSLCASCHSRKTARERGPG